MVRPRHESLEEWRIRTNDIPMPRADRKIQWQVDYERQLAHCTVCGHTFCTGEVVHVAWDDYESWCSDCLRFCAVDTVGYVRTVEAGAVDEEVVRAYEELGLPYVDLRKVQQIKED
jgi:hypothetical protein